MEILLFTLCAISLMISWSYFQQLVKGTITDLGQPTAAETMSVVAWSYSWALLGFNYILLFLNLHSVFGNLLAGVPEIISGLVTLHFVGIAFYARARYQREPKSSQTVRVTEVLLRIFSVLFTVTAVVLLRAFPDLHQATLDFSGSAIPDTFFQIWMILTALTLTIVVPRTRSHRILSFAGLSLLIGACAAFLGYHHVIPSSLGSIIGWGGSLVGVLLVALRGFFLPSHHKLGH